MSEVNLDIGLQTADFHYSCATAPDSHRLRRLGLPIRGERHPNCFDMKLCPNYTLCAAGLSRMRLVLWGYLWDWPNLMGGEAATGQRGFGADYYQNLRLWAVPAALAGQDLTGPAQPGGLVERVIRAARG